ncbi:MAG: glycosyltransferase family 2 protein [Acetivibrio ethanolgignens]
MKKILLTIPAYNEEENIGLLLERIKKEKLEEQMDILVIDDGSTDKTAQIVCECGYQVIRQIFNMGYGAALQTAYKYGVEKGYDYLLQIDADGQHDLKNIDTICKRLGCFAEGETDFPDIVIGSRFLEGSQSFCMSKLKMLAINMFRSVIKHNTGNDLTDPTSGLQGLNRRAFSFYARYGNFDLKYPDMNMVIQMLLLGYKIEEFPAIMHKRTAGTSMHSGLLKVAKYMILMCFSSLNVYLRYRK